MCARARKLSRMNQPALQLASAPVPCASCLREPFRLVGAIRTWALRSRTTLSFAHVVCALEVFIRTIVRNIRPIFSTEAIKMPSCLLLAEKGGPSASLRGRWWEEGGLTGRYLDSVAGSATPVAGRTSSHGLSSWRCCHFEFWKTAIVWIKQFVPQNQDVLLMTVRRLWRSNLFR